MGHTDLPTQIGPVGRRERRGRERERRSFHRHTAVIPEGLWNRTDIKALFQGHQMSMLQVGILGFRAERITAADGKRDTTSC
jgi:hypothetical protein